MSAQKSQRTNTPNHKHAPEMLFTKHMFSVRLATEVGVEKAVLLDNIYFWIAKNRANDKHFIDGEWWSYNSSKAFGQMFPYMKDKSISRWLRELESDGYIKSGNYNKVKFDRTKWFSLTDLGFSFFESSLPILSNGELEKGQPIPDSKPDKKDIVGQDPTMDVLKKTIEYLNAKTFRTFKETSKGHQRHINARLKEGFLFEDFKAVIDFKAEQWLKDETMKSYLRPETLFGNKFDGYLQEAKPQVTFHDRNYANGAIVRIWSDGREERIREADK